MFESIDNIHILTEKDFTQDDLKLLDQRDFDFCKDFHESRKEEYLISRTLVQKIFKRLDISHSFLDKGARKEPIWPNGINGSISHSKGCVMVVVSKEHASIGLDIEHKHRVSEKLYHKLFSEKEVQIIKDNGSVFADILFSAKEAFYKMQYPITKQYLDFLDVELDLIDNQLQISYVSDVVIKLDSIQPILIEEDGDLVGCLSLGDL